MNYEGNFIIIKIDIKVNKMSEEKNGGVNGLKDGEKMTLK